MFMTPRNALWICLLVATTACTTVPTTLPVKLDLQEANKLLAPGPNRITGRIKFEPDRGHVLAYPDTVVSCEEREVTLIPLTDYAREWALKYYGKPVTDLAYKLTHRAKNMQFDGYEAFMAATRKTMCDAGGNFAFEKVADGDYFVFAKVEWSGKDQEMYKFAFASEDVDVEDGTIIKKVSLKGGQVVELNGPWP